MPPASAKSMLPPGFVPTRAAASNQAAHAAAQRRARPASWAPEGEWRLYRAWGWLPPESGLWRRFLAWLLGGWQQLLYIGVTERTTIARWAEHMKDKDWAPQIACWERDETIYRSEAEVLAAETAAIWAERPVHNIAKNGNNPGAVHVRRRLHRHVVARRIRVALWTLLWLAVALGLGVWSASADTMSARDGLYVGVGGATGFIVLVGWRFRRPRRRRRR
jgi:hypothetical protein